VEQVDAGDDDRQCGTDVPEVSVGRPERTERPEFGHR